MCLLLPLEATKSLTLFFAFSHGLLYSIRKLIRRDSGNLAEYALCPKCDQLYLLSECAVNGKIVAKMCDYIEFPNHTHKEKRAEM